jgi:molybdopterin/thiamine biosynthesis adenylyltransferase
VYLLTLARLGVGSFNIADFDTFNIVNFNRQAGANVSTLGRPKVDVLAEQARDINPELNIARFPEGIAASNVDEFLADVDLYIDGLDFFAFSAREQVFAACARLGIPAMTAAPLGMGVAWLNFLPGRMTFEEYFGWSGQSDDERALRFLVGLAPASLHRRYLVDPSTVNLEEHRGPSTVVACQLCAGVAAAEAVKILLLRGDVLAAPWGQRFDAYRHKYARTWRPGGHRNPLLGLARWIGRRELARIRRSAE